MTVLDDGTGYWISLRVMDDGTGSSLLSPELRPHLFFLKIPRKIRSRGKLNEKSCDFQEKAAFILCVEDRAMFFRDCDKSIHIPGTLSEQHQRLLATGIRVALNCGQTEALTGKSLTDPPVNVVPRKSHSDFAPSDETRPRGRRFHTVSCQKLIQTYQFGELRVN